MAEIIRITGAPTLKGRPSLLGKLFGIGDIAISGKKNKYKYWAVIQQNFGYGWDDIVYYETDSTGYIVDPNQRKEFAREKKDYRLNQPEAKLRVVYRKELAK